MIQVRKIRKKLENEKALKECARRFGVLGDLTKIKICYLLCHWPGLTVSEIAKILNMPISRVSHALRKLEKFGILKRRKIWRNNFYQFRDKNMAKLIKIYVPKLSSVVKI